MSSEVVEAAAIAASFTRIAGHNFQLIL